MTARIRGAHACSVLISAFCGDELRINVAACRVVSFGKSSRGRWRPPQVAAATAPRKPSPYHLT
jgi:hypothetical protein